MNVGLRSVARHALRTVLIVVATLYFLIDLMFLSMLRPLRRRLMALRVRQRIHRWVETLDRRAALLLLLVPWLILEPAKPVALYLFAHGAHAVAGVLIVASEVLKLTLLEQIFEMVRPKLMTFTWFAWGYTQWEAALAYLRALPAWRRMHAWYSLARAQVIDRLRSIGRRVANLSSTKEP